MSARIDLCLQQQARAKMRHQLPVPMVVVPRTRDHDNKNGAR